MFTRRSSVVALALIFYFSSSLALMSQTHGGGGGRAPIPRVAPRSNGGGSAPTAGNLPDTPITHLASEEGKLEFRTETILIQVPVVITDKNGNHIHGLTKENFRLLENGKEQTVSTFEEVVAANAKLPALPHRVVPGEFSNLFLPATQPRALTVIALDTLNTPFLDQEYGRRELVKYLAQNIDTNQVLALMIMSSHGIKIVQGLTADSARLLEVLKKVSGELPGNQDITLDAQADAATGNIPDVPMVSPGSDPSVAMEAFIERGDAIYAQYQQQTALETTLGGLRAIAWSLSGVPGRKALIWATGGFPFAITSPDAVPGGYLLALYERTMQALTEAQISVYPVDVRGLVNSTGMGDASRSRGPTAQQLNNRIWLQQSTIDSLNEFADMTGGKAFYNTNDLATSFKRAADDGSSYYQLGYYLDTKNNRAGWRQLKVKVDKKDTEVRARKGFFVTNATIRAELTRNSDMSYALSSPIEGTGVPLTVKWLGNSPDGDKKKAQFLIRLPPNGVSLEGRDQNQLNFEFALAAYRDKSKDTKPAATLGKNVTKTMSPEQLATVRASGMGFTNAVELPAGQYNVRIVIRDNVTGKIGSVTAPLTVN
ncbi:MAG TPA: VWA domain-containing protein [Candidatus Sulfotelmatobacter sp.]